MASPSKSESKEVLPPPSPDEFKKAVEESRATIQNETVKPKRSRGRPLGSTRKAPEQVGGPQPSVVSQPSVAGPPDITAYLMPPLIVLSKIPASRMGIPELVLASDEAHACAYSLNQILVAFAPQGQMNPKAAAIFGAFTTFGSVAFLKYQVYLDKKPKAPKPNPPPPEHEPTPETPFAVTEGPKISAMDAFKRG